MDNERMQLTQTQLEAARLRGEIERERMSTNYAHGDEPLMETLAQRHQAVSDLTKHYYQGDVIPPTTKSQVLRAQKFSVIYYYAMNAILFVYAFFIPEILKDRGPYFGGFDLFHDFHGGIAGEVIVCVVIVLILIRFVVLSWSAEFFQFAVLLVGLEVALCILTSIFWSRGVPMLLTLLFSNLLNIVVTQYYWKYQFTKVVKDLKELVPPAKHHVQDTTVVSVFDPRTLYVEFSKLWGFKQAKTPAMLYDERCGVFSTKDQMSHVEALHGAYMQALEPEGRWVPWRHALYDLWSINVFGLLDGLLNTFVSNAAVAFAGVWLGKVMFSDFTQGWFALACALIIIVVYFWSIRRTLSWLEEAMGVAVAEKEWLAHDVVKHTAQREEILFDVVDVMGTATTNSKGKMANPNILQKGRLNMVFMWLCVASTADFIGESCLAKVFWNVAHETRSMMEALTPYDFKLFPHAKWEVVSMGTMIKILQTLMLTFMSCVYFGSYFEEDPVPVPTVAVIGAACFIQSVVKLTEAVQFAFTILGAGNGTTHRHLWVSEWIVFVAFIFVLINVLIWLYLLPIMKHWDLPVGKCKEEFNRVLFPSACHGK